MKKTKLIAIITLLLMIALVALAERVGDFEIYRTSDNNAEAE